MAVQIESESILVPPCVFELALGAGTTYRFVFSRFLNFRVFTWTEYTLKLVDGIQGEHLDVHIWSKEIASLVTLAGIHDDPGASAFIV